MLEEKLIALGMTEREAKLYLAGLETGMVPASAIARHAGEKRVTVYQTLEHMVKKGWCNSFEKNHKTHYSMLEPKLLIKQFEKQTQALKDQLPSMVGMMNQYGAKPKVEYYDGREQLKDLFMRILEEGKTMDKDDFFLTFFGVTDMDAGFEKWLVDDFMSNRLTCPIKTRSLTSDKSHTYIDFTKAYHEARIVSDPVFDMANEIVIYGINKVALVMYNTEELSAVVVESVSFHRALKSIFYTLWNTLED